MKKRVQWSARELLSTFGFDDRDYVSRYSAQGLTSLECAGRSVSELGQGSYVAGEEFPEYVLCLVERLRARGLEYIVLRKPVGSHNRDIIDSFAYAGRHYIVEPWNWRQWFTDLPLPLQQIFDETRVTVEIPDQEE